MSETEAKNKHLPDFLSSDGELGTMIRNFNWDTTPLGPVYTWSQSLKTTVNLMLNSKNPIWVGWGPQNTFLYNDAYIDVLGKDKHSWALGKPASVVWEEIWDFAGPLSDKVYNEGIASSGEDVQLFMKRGDFLEEVYFSFAYSPVFDENGDVGGLFCPNFETTSKILNARRNLTLSELASKSLIEKTIKGAVSSAAATLAKNPADVPFAVFYLLNKKQTKAEIVQRVGLTKCTEAIFPQKINFAEADALAEPWVVAKVMQTGKPVFTNVEATDVLPLGLAGQQVKEAIALPLTSGTTVLGIIILGINPTRRIDRDYTIFFEMVAGQISTAVQNATLAETEKKRLEKLAEIDRAKTAFFSNISHEFRTPLTLMLGPLEDLMQNYRLAAGERTIIETAHRNAMRLLKLVNTLLNFSLVESGRLKAKFVPTDIAAFTANLAGNFRSLINRGGMDLVVDVDTVGENVFLDREMWEKIIFNLLSNAYKYTLKGTITVSLAKDAGNVVLKVSDTGVGIPKDELPKMFTRFHRVHNSVGRSFEGSGIGLSMIREFILQHGGTITVESKENAGSTFIVTLPLGSEHLPQEQLVADNNHKKYNISENYITETNLLGSSAEEKDIEVEHNDVGKAAETVLIVDDNADMRQHLKSIIETEFNILTAQNGLQALEIIRNRKISLVVSDIMMPVMDGISMLKEIKKHPSTAPLPVILLTARAGEESRIEGYETGADDYLVKPFSAKELLARIKAQVKISNLRGHIREELKNLFMQAPMAICILRGKNYVVEMANANIMKLWGKSQAEMLNRPLFEGLPEAKAQGFDKLLDNVYTTGKEHVEDEYPFSSITNGVEEQFYVKFIYQPFREENGDISGIIVLAHDVTPQVLARKKIEENEAKIRNFINQAPVGIIILKGEDLVVDTANRIYGNIVGRNTDDIIGRKFIECMPEMKDTPVVKNLLKVYREGVNHVHTELPVDIVKDGVKATGYYNSIYQPLIENDTITGVIAIVNEVTQQYLAKRITEKNEKDLILILETMPHIAYRADATGSLTYYNSKFFSYTGLTFNQAKNDGWRPAIHPAMLESVQERWMHSIATGEEYDNAFLLKRASDQSYRWHLSRAVALRNDYGEITQWVGTLTDIHEQKVFAEKLEAMVNDRTEKLHRSNAMLAQKNKELEQSNKELESFNYVASHDLQEPLRKIRTFINMIKDKGRDDNYDLYLSKIDSSAERMSELIRAVLTYSRLSSGSDTDETVDLNEILQQVLNDFELLIDERGVVIHCDNLPRIKAIPLQINQLFSNLISNSLKYCNDKPIIKITCREIRGYDITNFKGSNISRQFVELRFTDNGIGFEEQYNEQIFKLFQRLHGKNEYSGTGIGLSICKKIVEQHEGYISAESAPGRGATFTVQLPIA